MIVFEGTDAVGKTTAVKEICAMNGMDYKHIGPPGPNFKLADHLQLVDDNTVFDRFHLGYLVYGRMLGKYSTDVTKSKMKSLCRFLDYQGVYTVIMYCSDTKRLLENVDSDRELYSEDDIVMSNDCWSILAQSKGYCDLAWDIATKGYPTSDDLVRIHAASMDKMKS